ncbi:MAG: PQQ-binding-like beta-propeller repeat protein [Verrucomicrobia bacterium]|nr:PQQ-binding-like beta-propeller repeat protein [Verrucomicrobiota bacterium]
MHPSATLAPLLCLSLGIALVTSTRAGDDWPWFLGPHANGISDETGLLDRWPASGPPLLWSKSVGAGYSAPSVRGQRLVLHHRVGDQEIVECLDAATGQTRWRYGYPSHFVDPYGYNNGPRGTPLLTTNRCYTFGAEGKLLCLDLASGRPVWQRDSSKDWEIPPAFFGVGSTPVLDRGRLLVMIGGQPNAGMVALDPATGRTLWESVGEKNWEGATMNFWPGERTLHWQRWEKMASYATPVVAEVNGRPAVFCFMRQGLVLLEPATGRVDDSFFFQARVNESVNASDPIVVSNEVFISSAYYKSGSVLLRVRPDRPKFEVVWHSLALELHFMTPIYHDGYLYAFSGRNPPDARFRCVEFQSGKIMWDLDQSWQQDTATPSVYGRGSCLLADGKLVVLGEGGLLGCFAPNPKRPEEICRWQVPRLHYPCWTAPVLAQHRLYLRGEDHLVCLDLARRSR